MSRTPLEWHKHPQAQVYIGEIADLGISSTSRTIDDRIGGCGDVVTYACPQFCKLAEMQQDALTDALNAAQTDKSLLPVFDQLVRQDLGTLIASEIAQRQQVAA